MLTRRDTSATLQWHYWKRIPSCIFYVKKLVLGSYTPVKVPRTFRNSLCKTEDSCLILSRTRSIRENILLLQKKIVYFRCLQAESHSSSYLCRKHRIRLFNWVRTGSAFRMKTTNVSSMSFLPPYILNKDVHRLWKISSRLALASVGVNTVEW